MSISFSSTKFDEIGPKTGRYGEHSRKSEWGSVFLDKDYLSRKSVASKVIPMAKLDVSSRGSIPKKSPIPQKELPLFERNVYMIIIQFATLISLFAYDFNRAFLPPSMDLSTDVILTIVFLIFIVDMVLQLWMIPQVYKHVNFWFDVLGTLSMIPELQWLSSIFGLNISELTIAKSARLIRIQSKLFKLFRSIKILRFTRLIKNFTEDDTEEQDMLVSSYGQVEIRVARNPGILGHHAAQKVTTQCVFLVILMLFVLPFFEAPGIIDSSAFSGYLQLLQGMPDEQSLIYSIQEYRRVHPTICQIIVGGVSYYDSVPNSRRNEELLHITYDTSSIILDVRKIMRSISFFQILTTLFVIMILAYICISTSTATQKLVTGPLERLTHMVTKLTHSLVALGGSPELTAKIMNGGYLTKLIEEQMQCMWDSAADDEQEKANLITSQGSNRGSKRISESEIDPERLAGFDEKWQLGIITLMDVLDCPFAMEFFRQFSITSLVCESYTFVVAALAYARDFQNDFHKIIESHILPQAHGEINVSHDVRREIISALENKKITPFVFDEAAKEIYSMLEDQYLKRFLESMHFKTYKQRILTLSQDDFKEVETKKLMQHRSNYTLRRAKSSLRRHTMAVPNSKPKKS